MAFDIDGSDSRYDANISKDFIPDKVDSYTDIVNLIKNLKNL